MYIHFTCFQLLNWK